MIALIDGDTQKCCTCKEIKNLKDFHRDTTAPKGHTYRCIKCALYWGREYYRKYKNDPNYRRKARNSYIKTKHGISLQQYEEKVAAQNYECAVCRVKLSTSGNQTHLDHCHKSGKIRAILCTNCNRGLGHFKDSINILQQAVHYLVAHNPNGMVKEDISQ